MKSLFITGGTGFFGKSILSFLKRHPFPEETAVTILSRAPERFLEQYPEFSGMPRVQFLAGDVRDFAFPTGTFDAVIHAATPAVTDVPDAEMMSIILDGTQHVLEFAKQCGCQKFMFTSSGAVYGPQTAPVAEDAPCHPVTAYGKAKLAAEQMCVDSGLYTLLPRYFAFVGPYLNRDIHFAIGNFMRDCLANRPIMIHGDGTPLRSYLYADDLVAWLFAILEKGESGRPYNIGSDHALSIREVAETVRSVLHSDNEICVQGRPSLEPPSVYVPDISRIKTELGVTVRTSLKESIVQSVGGAR